MFHMTRKQAVVQQFGVWSISLFLAAVFLVSSGAKISAYEDFQVTLLRSQLLVNGYGNTVARLIIGIEIATALGLLIPKVRLFALRVMAGLCCVFIAYSTWRWVRHISVPCSCFGALFRMTPAQAIALNLGLLGLATVLLRLQEWPADAQKPATGSDHVRQGGMPLKT